jgi:methylmalonyl-CoA mutase
MNDLSIATKLAPYRARYKVRFVTATSPFDGHDAPVNIMRRILQITQTLFDVGRRYRRNI